MLKARKKLFLEIGSFFNKKLRKSSSKYKVIKYQRLFESGTKLKEKKLL